MQGNGSERLRGCVKWFSEDKGYGFIAVEGREKDVFIHWTGIAGTGRRNLARGDVVEFYLETSKLTQKEVAIEAIKVG